jgi:small subunit ribosomal protein S14
MAKTSSILREQKRKKLIARDAAKRADLRKKLKDANVPIEDKAGIVAALEKLPKNSCPTRQHSRCLISGRPRGFHRKFQLSRIALRDYALKGWLPGVRKSSW